MGTVVEEVSFYYDIIAFFNILKNHIYLPIIIFEDNINCIL